MIGRLRLLLRLGLGGLFVFAGVAKLRDPSGFATEITNYHLLPSLAPWLAVSLPTAELAIGAALLVGTRPWLRAGALAAAALLAVFTVAVAQVVARGIDVSCGCFGSESGPVTIVTVFRDVALLASAAMLLYLSPASDRAR